MFPDFMNVHSIKEEVAINKKANNYLTILRDLENTVASICLRKELLILRHESIKRSYLVSFTAIKYF